MPVLIQPVAAGSDLNTTLRVVGTALTITAVTFTPVAAITGAATDNRSVFLVNKGPTGALTNIVASLGFITGSITAAQYVPRTITLSATPANLDVAVGDVLIWQSIHAGTGIADPGGLVTISAVAKYL
jgi:hypothetical protein